MYIENGVAEETSFLKIEEKLIRYIRNSNVISACLALSREIKGDQSNEGKVIANDHKKSKIPECKEINVLIGPIPHPSLRNDVLFVLAWVTC